MADITATMRRERYIIGYMITHPQTVEEAVNKLQPDDFRTKQYRRLFVGLSALYRRGEKITSGALYDEMCHCYRRDRWREWKLIILEATKEVERTG